MCLAFSSLSRPIALAAFALLSACGGGGTPSTPPSTTPAATTPVAVTPQVSAAACSSGLSWGVNVHQPTSQWARLPDVLAPRGIKHIRMGLWGNDLSYVQQLRTLASSLASRQIHTSAIIFDSYANGYPAAQVCNADLATVEQNAYNEAKLAVTRTEDLIHDYELLNEVSLYPNIQVAGTTGQSASDFDTACGRLQAANLRGMARAVADERSRTGLPLRVILGTVNRHFGFYKFMQAQGVNFDVSGYHIYPWEGHRPLDQDPWFGAGGPIGQLALFGKPIQINEFNCGEIYGASYENQAGQPQTEACLRSVSKHLQEVVNQTVANIESVYFYELTDEPAKAAPENRFGLMADLDTPKVAWFLASAFAGGAVSGSEANELTSRGLLTPTQIANWAGCGARP